jgi:hypothetical protein
VSYYGEDRDPNHHPQAPISPFDRSPIPRSIASDDSKLATGKNIIFAVYCGWVFISDDGGCSLVIHPGRAGGPPMLGTSGRVVWIGDGACRVTYTGMAPVREIRLIGCTAEDARVYASNGATASASTNAEIPNGTTLESVEISGGDETYSPPAGTLYTIVTLYDAGSACAVGTDATVPVNIGPAAQLSSWTHYGTSDIHYNGVNAEFINFTNYTRT